MALTSSAPSTSPIFFVVGDVMLDLYCSGDVDRISREAPVPIVKFINQEPRLGGAANVVANLRSQNYACKLFGIAGTDKNHDTLKSLLDKSMIVLYLTR